MVAFVTKKFKDKAFNVGMGIAQKFEGTLIVVDCVYKNPPKFVFFETKEDKRSYEKTKKQVQDTLCQFEKKAEDAGIPLKTKVALTDSIPKWLADFAEKKETDLLIIDHPRMSAFEEEHFDDMIKSITDEIKIPILLLRS
jgi:hypothetical protein